MQWEMGNSIVKEFIHDNPPTRLPSPDPQQQPPQSLIRERARIYVDSYEREESDGMEC